MSGNAVEPTQGDLLVDHADTGFSETRRVLALNSPLLSFRVRTVS